MSEQESQNCRGQFENEAPIFPDTTAWGGCRLEIIFASAVPYARRIPTHPTVLARTRARRTVNFGNFRGSESRPRGYARHCLNCPLPERANSTFVASPLVRLIRSSARDCPASAPRLGSSADKGDG